MLRDGIVSGALRFFAGRETQRRGGGGCEECGAGRF